MAAEGLYLELMLRSGWESEFLSFSRTPLVSLKSPGLDCSRLGRDTLGIRVLAALPVKCVLTLGIHAHFIQPTGTNEELMNHGAGSNK